MIIIYHNPRCRKSRAGLEYLSEKTKDFEVVDYIKNGISEVEIREILEKMEMPAKRGFLTGWNSEPI